MLSLRLKRIGRTGHAQFRLIAQDRRFSPKSGRITAYLGSYNPHTKKVELDVEKINAYLKNGAQPSPRVVKLLKKEGIKLPAWVAKPLPKRGSIRNPDKRRSTRPAGAPAPSPAQTLPDKVSAGKPKTDMPAEAEAKTVEEQPAEAKAAPVEQKPETQAKEEPKDKPAAESTETPDQASQPEEPTTEDKSKPAE